VERRCFRGYGFMRYGNGGSVVNFRVRIEERGRERGIGIELTLSIFDCREEEKPFTSR